MNDSIKAHIERSLNVHLRSFSRLSGGSIASAYRADLDNGKTVFVKIDPQHDDMFVKEANGLRELLKSNTIRIPEVLHADDTILLLEFLPVTPILSRSAFFETFGKQLAALHRTTSDLFGFTEDNYIGSTPQKNLPQNDSWKEFFFVNRLEFQFRLAEANGYADRDLTALFKKIETLMERLIPNDGEKPTLLHGDLWSGNFLCVENSIPALIDPAVYYGHREADIAMTLLFGGFDDSFYASYNEAYPLNDEWERRMEVYKLYHLFNHLNLFGEGYSSQAYETMKRLLK